MMDVAPLRAVLVAVAGPNDGIVGDDTHKRGQSHVMTFTKQAKSLEG